MTINKKVRGRYNDRGAKGPEALIGMAPIDQVTPIGAETRLIRSRRPKGGQFLMEDQKGSSHENFEERVDWFWTAVVDNNQRASPAYASAMLIKGSERLKSAVEENLKGIEKLRASTEESSRQANRLSTTIRNLTRALVWLTAIAVVLTGLSIYVLLHSAR